MGGVQSVSQDVTDLAFPWRISNTRFDQAWSEEGGCWDAVRFTIVCVCVCVRATARK